MKFLYYLVLDRNTVMGTNDPEQAERYQEHEDCAVIYAQDGQTFDFAEKHNEPILEAVRIDESGCEEEDEDGCEDSDDD